MADPRFYYFSADQHPKRLKLNPNSIQNLLRLSYVSKIYCIQSGSPEWVVMIIILDSD